MTRSCAPGYSSSSYQTVSYASCQDCERLREENAQLRDLLIVLGEALKKAMKRRK